MSTRSQAVRGQSSDRYRIRERPLAAKGVGLWFIVTVLLVAVWVLALGVIYLYQDTYQERVYLGVRATGVDLSAYTQEEARLVLTAAYQRYALRPLVLRYGDQAWEVTPAELGMRFDVERTVVSAYNVGREGGLFQGLRAQLDAYRHGVEVTPPLVTMQDGPARAFLTRLESRINLPMKEPQVLVGPDLTVIVTPVQTGRKLDVEGTLASIENRLQALSSEPVDLLVHEISPRVAEADLVALKEMADQALASPMQARYEDRTWTLEREELARLLVFRLPTGGEQTPELTLDRPKLESWLSGLAKEINRPAQNARFHFAGPGQLSIIRHSEEGRRLEVAEALDLFQAQLLSENRIVDLPVSSIKPKVSDADATSLNIQELIIEASSVYGPGLPARLHNVELAAALVNGVVVLPGEIFSFNQELGPATLEVGFQTGWGIYSTGEGGVATVPTVAGGICQVATTLFQSAFWAGYTIEERYWHLYWIPRYGDPPRGMQGLDATVDQALDPEGKRVIGGLDLKFRNNGGDPLLVQARTDGTTLYFDLYGVKPNWEVKVEGPHITNVIKASQETVRQEDPNMPAGQELWIEQAQDGFTATIVRTVTLNGHLVERKEFVSKYQPSRNVVLVGTKQH